MTGQGKAGPLRNGNRQGPKFGPDWPGKLCWARCKRTGWPCRNPAVKGKERCRMHGGKSTGAETKEGIDRIKVASTKHGAYAGPNNPVYPDRPYGHLSPAAIADRRKGRADREESRASMRALRRSGFFR